MEYLMDYASPDTRAQGEAAISKSLAKMDDVLRAKTERMLAMVREGQRDIYC
jgi:2-iminoacetate synthase